MIELREYQSSLVDQVRTALRTNKNVLLQSPTGSGKTAIATHMLGRVVDNGKTGWFICHRRELIDQTSRTFEKFGIHHGFIAAGYPVNPLQKIQICSIDTLKNRLDKVKPPDFIMWDECQHNLAAGWLKVHKHYDNAFHVGLSATPQRLDGKGLNGAFDYLVNGPQTSWLIDKGYLAKYKLYSVPGVNLEGVHTRMGDFVKAESTAAMDRPSITGNIVSHWKKHARDKLTIGFAVTVKHSQHIVEQFKAAGIMAVHLDGETPKAERKAVLRSLANGDVRVVFNVGLFGEGYDIAANSGLDVTIGCVIDAAPTQSLSAWLQRCGRSLRPQNGHAIILDHSGNALRHGMPCMDREWTLEGREKQKGRSKSDDEPAFSVRQCDKCYFVFQDGNVCPECGHVHIVENALNEVAGELEELDPQVVRMQMKKEQGQAQSIDELIELGIKRKYKSPEKWAVHIFTARQHKARRLNYG